MKNKDYRKSKLKHQLIQKKLNGQKVLYWRISSYQQLQDIQEIGGIVEPYLYEIKTRKFYNVNKLPCTLLKDLHYLNKRGTIYEVRRLRENEKRTLDEFGIRYRPIKFKVFLDRIG